MGDPNGEKKESGLKRFFSKLFGGHKNEKKAEKQEVTTRETSAKPTDEPKVSFSEPEPQNEAVQSKRASGVKEIASTSRPMSLFVQKGIEDSDDEPLSCSDTSSDESDEDRKDSVKNFK